MGANDNKEDTLAELYSTIPRSTLIEVYKKYWFDYEMFGYDFNQVLELGGYKSLTELEKSEILLKFPEVHRKHDYHSNFSKKSVKQMFETKTAKLISKRKNTSLVHRKKK